MLAPAFVFVLVLSFCKLSVYSEQFSEYEGPMYKCVKHVRVFVLTHVYYSV